MSRSDWGAAPLWFQWALHEVGVDEVPGSGDDPRIIEYRKLAKIAISGDDGDIPWCSIFVNAALEQNGFAGTRSAAARSFEKHEGYVRLPEPALGAVCTMWRGSPSGWQGHVGFYRGENASHVYLLGGNQGDSVSIAPFPKAGRGLGVNGFYWPKGAPIMQTGVIPIRAGAPLREVSAV